MGRTVQRSLEDNPMAFGAAALLAGVAIALALPATRQERQLLGDMRDQVMDRAQTFATNIAEEAKQVVEEVKPRLEETAQRVVDDIKLSGMQVSEDLKQTTKDAGHEVKQTLKEAGKSVKSKVESQAGGSQSAEDTQIVSGIIVEEGEESQMEPNVGGSYDSKFDAKS
jgi:gas vesicle protein